MWIFKWFPVDPQNYIARFGHGSAKLARQAQSKEKTLQKMVASGLTERVVNDKVSRAFCLDLDPSFAFLILCLVSSRNYLFFFSFFFRPCHFIFLPVGRSPLLSLWFRMSASGIRIIRYAEPSNLQ